MAEIGLVLNLKMPNLTWTDETVPVKQSMGVLLALLGGWIIVMAFMAAYYFLSEILSPVVYMICVAFLLLAVSVALFGWLRSKGTRIFETL